MKLSGSSKVNVDPSSASGFSRVLQGQEFSTLRGNFAERESNESDNAEKSVAWTPQIEDEKIDMVSCSRRYGSENWVQSGRQEPTYTDLLSGFGANADSSHGHGYNTSFVDQPLPSASLARKSLMDQDGKFSFLSRPWPMMSPGLSLKLADSNSKVAGQGGDVTYQVRGNVRYGGFGDYPMLQGHRIEQPHGNWLMPPPQSQFENPAHSREFMAKPALGQDNEAGKPKDGNCRLFGIPLNPGVLEPTVAQRNTVNDHAGHSHLQYHAFDSDQKSEQTKSSSKMADDTVAINEQETPSQPSQPHTKETRNKPHSSSARSCTKVILSAKIPVM